MPCRVRSTMRGRRVAVRPGSPCAALLWRRSGVKEHFPLRRFFAALAAKRPGRETRPQQARRRENAAANAPCGPRVGAGFPRPRPSEAKRGASALAETVNAEGQNDLDETCCPCGQAAGTGNPSPTGAPAEKMPRQTRRARPVPLVHPAPSSAVSRPFRPPRSSAPLSSALSPYLRSVNPILRIVSSKI